MSLNRYFQPSISLKSAEGQQSNHRQYQPIRVLDIELSSQLRTIQGLNRYSTFLALVRLHDSPLGYVHLPLIDGCCTAGTLEKVVLDRLGGAIVDHLARDGVSVPQPDHLRLADLVGVPHPPYMGPFPMVTVAVCTRNRPTYLALCLDALRRLDYPALDILVVDNAPRDDSAKCLVHSLYPNARYVCASRPGLSWARNRAITEAKGEIIAYIDDDVIVDSGWARALVQTFAETPEIVAVTGLVVPYELETPAQVLFELYGGFGRGFRRTCYRLNGKTSKKMSVHYAPGSMGTGANMAYRRDLFNRIAPFDPALGAGTVTTGGEDIEMFFRVTQNGYTLMYEPDAIVRHRHRRDYAGLYKQITHNGIGFSSYLVRSALAYPSLRSAFTQSWIKWFWNWIVKRLGASLVRRNHIPPDLILAEFWGGLVGLGRYHRSQNITKRRKCQGNRPSGR